MARKSNASNAADERLKMGGATEQRGARGMDDEEDDDREGSGLSSETDFEAFLEDEFSQVALPSPPNLAGWHLCWLTTSSQYDTLARRQRLGYVPVMQAEMPAFDPNVGAAMAADTGGFIRCNEMILCKIENARYQAIMRHFHHKRPLQEEETIMSNKPKDGVAASDRSEDGLAEMEARIEQAKKLNPTFS